MHLNTARDLFTTGDIEQVQYWNRSEFHSSRRSEDQYLQDGHVANLYAVDVVFGVSRLVLWTPEH